MSDNIGAVIGEAMARAEAGANPEWVKASLEIIRDVALRMPYMDTDAVFVELDRRGIDTPERRAMGPVMNMAVKQKWVELKVCNFCGTTKVTKASTRPESHGKDTAIYKSLLYVRENDPDMADL